MAVDMKEMMAQAVMKLITEKKVRKITVRDIVEECHITRQAFYYHFADIPDLLQWTIQQRMQVIQQDLRKQASPKECVRYCLLLALNAKPYVENGMRTNYSEDIEKILFQQLVDIFLQMLEEDACADDMSEAEKRFLVRYHCYAIMGILRNWTEEDTKNIDPIIDRIVEMASHCRFE